ncbi:CARDB domain-containing protein, partial [Candidatus Hydrogenedentota bacterium]
THGPATQMAIAGITITPYEKWPLELVRQRLFVDRSVTNKDAVEGAAKYNAGDREGAETGFARIPDSEYLLKVAGYLAIAGHFDTSTEDEVPLIDTAKGIMEKAVKADPGDIVAEELLQIVTFYGEGLYRMLHASERGLGQVRSEAIALFQWISPGNNLYSKALSYIGRCYAQTDPHRWVTSWYLAEEAFIKLEEIEPGNKVSGYYLRGDLDGWDFIDYTGDIEGAPKWAALIREAYNRMLDQAEWWGKNRQLPDGRLGGGWGDDVEIGLAWEALMLVNPDASPAAMETTRAIAEGVWWGGEIDRDAGYFDGLADVEHTAEWTGDSQPLMIGIDYGNPTYYERCLKTGKLMRDLWMDVNDAGHLHFKSMALGNKRIGKEYGGVLDAEIDHPLNGRAVSAASWAWWYSPVSDLEDLMTGWAKAWFEDSKRAENGKPAWIIPGPIGFHTDNIGGNHAKVWKQGEPKVNCYENPRYTGYINALFARMYKETGDEKWLKPKEARSTAKAVDMDNLIDITNLLEGTVVEDKYAKLDDGYKMERIVEVMRDTWPSVTSEVANTDRIGMPGMTQVLKILTGGTSWNGMDFVPVTFEKMSRHVAFMNLASTTTTAKSIFYNFNEDEEQVNMKLWILEVGGEYKVSVGIDENDDDVADKTLKSFTYKHVHRGDSISFTIPSRQAVVVEVSQTKRGEGMPEEVVDLAMASEDIKYEDGKLSVTVHNIGNKAAGPFSAKIWQGEAKNGKLLGSFLRDGLEAPHDLEPRVTTEIIDWTMPRGATLENPVKITVEIDPEEEYYEITERNNVISREFPFELKAYEAPRMWKTLAQEHGVGNKFSLPFPADFPKDRIR